MKKFLLAYCAPAVGIIILDQFTKWLMRLYGQETIQLTSFLDFELTLNRGISWGLFQSSGPHSPLFIGISGIIILLTLGLAIYAFKRYRQGHTIFGETFIIAGSVANLIDRFVFSGVLDFIVLHWNTYSWPVFNVADIFIVFGVGIMFVQHFIFDTHEVVA